MVEWLTVNDVMRMLHVGKNTVLAWMHSGKLPYTNLGERSYRISKDDLDNFLKERRA